VGEHGKYTSILRSSTEINMYYHNGPKKVKLIHCKAACTLASSVVHLFSCMDKTYKFMSQCWQRQIFHLPLLKCCSIFHFWWNMTVLCLTRECMLQFVSC
jgi:hypothetical protein